MKPTFTAKFLRDGSTAIQCRQTGDRFIIADDPFRHQAALYHNGQLCRIGSRRQCLDEAERMAQFNLSH